MPTTSIGGRNINELKKLRVLIAEDEALVRQGMAALLSPHVKETVQTCDGEQAIFLLKSEAFDIALIDIGLPKRTGLDVMNEVIRRKIPVKIIMLTGNTETYSPAAVQAAGADAFLYKTTNAEQFLATFMAVANGSPVSKNHARESDHASSIAEIRETLTPRELQIIKILVEGASNQETAEILSISEHTVRKHREHINKKLAVKSPTALASFAIKAGLV